MTEELKKKMPLVIEKLLKQTSAKEIEWLTLDDGYETNFGEGTIELTYSTDDGYDMDEQEIEPEFLMLIFANKKGVRYDIFIAERGESPVYNNFLKLLKEIGSSPKENLPMLIEQFLGDE